MPLSRSLRFLPSIKLRIARLIYPLHSVRTVLRGPMRGMRFTIVPGMGATYALGQDHWNFRMLSAQVPEGATVYDIGANCGQMTLFFSRIVGPNGRVLSFEPAPDNIRLLRENIALNHCGNVELHGAAVAADEMPRRFSFVAEAHTMGTFEDTVVSGCKSDQAIVVPCVTLDALVARGAAPPQVLKIDVEGSGLEVIQGALATIDTYRPAVYFEIHAVDDAAPELQALKILQERFGYHVQGINTPDSSIFRATWGSAVWCSPPHRFHEPDQEGTPTSVCPVSAIIPSTGDRPFLSSTLETIQSCLPAPDEIIVHLDGCTPTEKLDWERRHPNVRFLSSTERCGPGGSRNKLIAAAKNELVANFDDDSFPRSRDYFGQIVRTVNRFPHAAIISAASMESEWRVPDFLSIAVSSGCGCVYRRSWFHKTAGFVPLPIAYSMEEVDLSLQIHALGGMIVHDPNLRVLHDKVPGTHLDARTNANILANTALFPFLRFPWWLWPVGVWQLARRIFFLVSHGWTSGLGDGLSMIPPHLAKHRLYIRRLSGRDVISWFWLRYFPFKVEGQASVAVAGAK